MRKTLTALTLSLAACGGVVSPPAAEAAGSGVVSIQAPRPAWGIRPVASRIDEQVNGLRIVFRECRASDKDCVRVVIANYGETWAGQTSWQPGNKVTIRLNTYYTTKRSGYGIVDKDHTSCHELGHVLGVFDHHNRRTGCVTNNSTSNRLDGSELRILRDRWRP